jgi:hypothetical protein
LLNIHILKFIENLPQILKEDLKINKENNIKHNKKLILKTILVAHHKDNLYLMLINLKIFLLKIYKNNLTQKLLGKHLKINRLSIIMNKLSQL